MKDPAAFIFFLIIILGIIFEKITKFKKMQQKNRPESKESKESAEQFFRRLRKERIQKEKLEPEAIQEPTPVSQSSIAEQLTEGSLSPHDEPINKKRKKVAINFHDKNKVQQAYMMKAILDRPQAYKF